MVFRMSVRNRIFAIILGMGTVIFGLLLAAVYTHTTKAYKEDIGEGFDHLAHQMAARIELALSSEILQTRVLTNQRNLILAIEQANAHYLGRNREQVMREIERIDKGWEDSDHYRHIYTPDLNPTSELLTRHLNLDPQAYAEIFVTDRHGALVASTNRTTDYYQADERWWQVAFNGGRGSAYVSNLEFDASAQVHSVTVALPVMDFGGTSAVGVLKAVLRIHKVLDILAMYKLGETGHVHLLYSLGNDLLGSSGLAGQQGHVIYPAVLGELRSSSKGYLIAEESDKERFILGFATVSALRALGEVTFDGGKWYVVVDQNLDEAYAPVYRLMKTLLALGLLAMVALYLTIMLTARTITVPLKELRKGTQRVRDGDLGQRVELRTGDELEDLAGSFNEMTEKLQASYAALKQRTIEIERSLDALGRSEARYRSVLETSRSGIFVCDESKHFPIFNPSFAEMLGYSIEEMREVTLSELVHPEDLPRLEGIRQAHMRGASSHNLFELRFIKRGGEEIVVEVSQGPYAPAGEAVGVICEVRDVTMRKRAERDLMRAHEELQDAYKALEQAQAKAIVTEKLAALGRVTAGVSHEILNPLNIITMRIYLMLNDAETPKEMMEPLKLLDEQASRIVKIVQELLYFAGQRMPHSKPTDLNGTVMRVLGFMDDDFELGRVEVELDLDESLANVLADEDQLKQVLFNIFTNALEAMPGGGRLTVASSLADGTGGTWVEVRVEDTGGGIPPEYLDKIFDPFFGTKPEGEGAGLGLSICKGIIEAHGGVIWAENMPEGGAAFSFRLGPEVPLSA